MPRRFRRIVERVTARDEEYFERHPGATVYPRTYWDPTKPIKLPTVLDDVELLKDGRCRYVVVPRSLVLEDFCSAA